MVRVFTPSLKIWRSSTTGCSRTVTRRTTGGSRRGVWTRLRGLPVKIFCSRQTLRPRRPCPGRTPCRSQACKWSVSVDPLSPPPSSPPLNGSIHISSNPRRSGRILAPRHRRSTRRAPSSVQSSYPCTALGLGTPPRMQRQQCCHRVEGGRGEAGEKMEAMKGSRSDLAMCRTREPLIPLYLGCTPIAVPSHTVRTIGSCGTRTTQ